MPKSFETTNIWLLSLRYSLLKILQPLHFFFFFFKHKNTAACKFCIFVQQVLHIICFVLFVFNLMRIAFHILVRHFAECYIFIFKFSITAHTINLFQLTFMSAIQNLIEAPTQTDSTICY